MNSCRQKTYNSPPKNWLSALKSIHLRQNSAVNLINGNLYHYAGNNPVKYTDPDGREDALPIPDIPKMIKGWIESECLDIANGFEDLKGRAGNLVYNLFHGKDVAVTGKASFSAFNFKFEGSATLKDGKLTFKGEDPSKSYLDESIASLQSLTGSPIIITSGGVNIDCKILSVDVGQDDEKNPQIGLSVSVPKLPDGLDISAGIYISVGTDTGPNPTSSNPSSEMRQRSYRSKELKNPLNYLY